MYQPTFEELYVISDLHLGGTRGSPIFKQGRELADLFRRLAKRQTPQGGKLALLLNGDIIDTLAQKLQGYVADPEEAETTLDEILSFPGFVEIWRQLAEFIAATNHHLLLVLGNHDLELAYPNIQEQLLAHLAGADEARRGRVSFVTSGAGFRCRVGTAAAFASVLCVHGNEFDKWNAVSPETMTRLVRAATLGKPSKFTAEPPNAGTKMVKDVMNEVKAEWPFVDLLKPEMDSVFNVLLALDPKRVGALGGVFGAFQSAFTVGNYRTFRVLGAEENPAAASELANPLEFKPGKELSKLIGNPEGAGLSLDRAWALATQGVEPEALVQTEQVLGVGRLLYNTLNFSARRLWNSQAAAMRAALADWGGGQSTWAIDGDCEVLNQLLPLKPEAEVVIAGHTHLRRQRFFPESSESQLYLNTGTWARLMRLTPEILATEERFAGLWTALKAGTMAALDTLPGDVVMNQTTVAVVRPRVGTTRVEAALCDYLPDPKLDDAAAFPVVPGAEWVIVKAN